jgi:hypothetical protein
MPGINDRIARFALLTAAILALIAVSPAAAQTPGASTYRSFPYLTQGGDLTGEGMADVLTHETTYERTVEGVGSFFPTSTVTARRGLDGSSLWQHQGIADELVPAPLGPQGGSGILVVRGPISGTVGWGSGFVGPSQYAYTSQERDLDLTALDGTGSQLWVREFDPGTLVGAVVADPSNGRRQAVAAHQYPVFEGVLQATSSPATDVLTTVLTRREVNDQIETSFRVVIVDGANGNLASDRTLTTTGSRPNAMLVGDVNGDRLDDVLVAGFPGAGDVTAIRGDNGATIWTNDGDVAGFDTSATNLGDVNGDSRDDVAVLVIGDIYDEAPPQTTVLDGSSGSVLFSTTAFAVTSVGEVDGEAALLAHEYDPVESEVDLRLLDAGGNLLRQRWVPVPEDDDGRDINLLPHVGDLDGDGVLDAGFEVVRNVPGGIESDRTFLSGRSLATIVDDEAGLPLLSSLDGGGDDLVQVERTSASSITVAAQDGAGGATRWVRILTADPAYPGIGRVSVSPADVDGDGIDDVILNVELTRVVEASTGGSSSESSMKAWVLRGTDGALLWSL